MIPMKPLTALFALAFCCAPAVAQYDAVQRVNFTPAGTAPTGHIYNPIVSADGRYVVYQSTALDEVDPPAVLSDPAFAGGETVVYRVDTRSGETIQVNLGSSGQALAPVNNLSMGARMAVSDDGNRVVWVSQDDDPGLGDANHLFDVYMRDIAAGTTLLVSASGSAGATGNSHTPSMSGDGMVLGFISSADDLVPGTTGGSPDGHTQSRRVYVRDLAAGTLTLYSDLGGHVTTDASVLDALVTPSGNQLVFANVPGSVTFPGVTIYTSELRIVDLATGSYTSNGNYMMLQHLSASSNAERIAFSTRSALTPGSTTTFMDIYVLDVATGEALHASTGTTGAMVIASHTHPTISYDGRYVQFISEFASHFFPQLEMEQEQVLLKDLETGLLTLVSVSATGVPGNSVGTLDFVTIGGGRTLDADGDVSVYASNYDTLPGNNLDAWTNAYVFDRRWEGRQLSVNGLMAGATADFTVTGASPNAAIVIGVSLTGQGPIPGYWGPLDLSGPVHVLLGQADANGEAHVLVPVPARFAGAPLWAKGVDFTASAPTTSYFGVVQ